MIMWQPGMTLDQMERSVIEAALRFYGDNKTMTAESLGVSVKTIHNKLGEYKEADILKKAAADEQAKMQQNELRRSRGLPMESYAEVSKEQPVSLPVGEEVQGMSPESAPSRYTPGDKSGGKGKSGNKGQGGR